MLQQLRSSAASLVAKLLVVLLIISFAAWGVTDYITQTRQDDEIATIGDFKVSAAELSKAFQLELDRFRSQGVELTREQARGLGLLDQVLDRLISSRVYEMGGDWLDMAVSDATVRKVIAEEPSFFDETGRFNRSRYEFVLVQSGISEGQFVADVRRDILRREIINSLDFPDKAPDALVAALHRWRGEKRVIDFTVVPVDPTLDVGEPDEGTMIALHQEHADRFTAPERRQLSYLHLSREFALGQVAVSDEELRLRYEENLAGYTIAERRTVQQILLADEASARRAAAAIGEGRTFEAVAREFAGQPPPGLELGTFEAVEFPIPDLWDVVAGLAEGSASQPLESPFGWHIFRVTKIMPQSVKQFEEARDAIEQELKAEHGADVLYQTSRLLVDELQGGATLEEAAAALTIPLRQSALIDIGGAGIGGNQEADLPGGDFLDTAFLTEAGERSDVMQLPEGDFYVLRVNEIVPSSLRPLHEVRDEVAALWKDDRRREAARERALAFVARVEAGESLADVSAGAGLTVTESKPFDRRGGGAASVYVTPVLASDVFRLQAGQAAMDESPAGFTIAQLKRIEPADPSNPGELPTILANQMVSDVLIQFNNGLRDRFGVVVDRAALNRF